MSLFQGRRETAVGRNAPQTNTGVIKRKQAGKCVNVFLFFLFFFSRFPEVNKTFHVLLQKNIIKKIMIDFPLTIVPSLHVVILHL